MGSKVGQKLVVVRKTEKLGEREHKALFPSEGKGHDDDDDEMTYKSCWHQFFYIHRRNVKRRTECFSEEFLHVCEEERLHTVSLQHFINEIHL